MVGSIDFNGCRRYIDTCLSAQTMLTEIRKAFDCLKEFFGYSSQDNNFQEMIELKNAVYSLEGEGRVFSRPPSPSSRIPKASLSNK